MYTNLDFGFIARSEDRNERSQVLIFNMSIALKISIFFLEKTVNMALITSTHLVFSCEASDNGDARRDNHYDIIKGIITNTDL